jgi:hypothetical protein
MENKNWKELWLKNYRGEGDTAELIEFVKKLNYGNRNNVSYLPWATVERIFKLQDGTIEIFPSKTIEDQNRTTIVETDRVLIKEEADSNGVITRTYANSYFINIRVMWQGQVHIERYPIQDSTGRPLSFWTQNDLNKSIQRGKVKAIAIISGIGFKLFEDGDLQFDVNPYEGAEPYEVSTKTPATPPKPIAEIKVEPKKMATNKPVAKQEPIVILEPPVFPTKVEVKVEQVLETKINRVELENEIKKVFLSGGAEKSALIRKFLTEAGTKKISELSDKEIQSLFELISK